MGKLRYRSFPIDYYGITLKDGAVIKNRIYHLTDGSAVNSINPCFDELSLRHLITCFSLGKESAGNYIKYDFKVNKDFWRGIIEVICDSFSFCSETLIHEVTSILAKFLPDYYLRVLGMTLNQQTSNTENVCFYFYTHKKIDVLKNVNLVGEILSLFAKNDTLKEIHWPICNEQGYLCFIAVDFLSNSSNKILL